MAPRAVGLEHVSVAARAAQVASAKDGPRPHPRTDHMIGTALALQVLLGVVPGGPETFVIAGQRTHVFDCMALANATLCSKAGKDASGQGSAVMFDRCLTHLATTVALLRPNVIVAQGWSAVGRSPSKAVAAAFGIDLPPKNSLRMVDSGGDPVAFVAAVHPARQWFSTTMAAWGELVGVLKEARREVLE